MGHVLILFGRYFRMFVRCRFFGPAHEIQRARRIGLFVAQRMKKLIAGSTALLFVLGMGLGGIGVQAGSGPSFSGVLLAKKDKDKEKEEKGLKDKEEQLESKAKELNAKEEALKKKEEELKKWEDTLKKRSKGVRPRSQQGAGAGIQQPPGAPAGFSPRTTNPQTIPQPNMAAPKSPSPPATATPPRQ